MKIVGRKTLRTDLEMRQTVCPGRANRLPFGGDRKETICVGTDCNACHGVRGQLQDDEQLYYCGFCN